MSMWHRAGLKTLLYRRIMSLFFGFHWSVQQNLRKRDEENKMFHCYFTRRQSLTTTSDYSCYHPTANMSGHCNRVDITVWMCESSLDRAGDRIMTLGAAPALVTWKSNASASPTAVTPEWCHFMVFPDCSSEEQEVSLCPHFLVLGPGYLP